MKRLILILAVGLLAGTALAQDAIDRAFASLDAGASDCNLSNELLKDFHPTSGELIEVKHVSTYRFPSSRFYLIDQVLRAFASDSVNAYYTLNGAANSNRKQLSLAVGEKGDCVTVGRDSDMSYRAACFADDEVPRYRSAYALEWKEDGNDVLCRSVYVYGVKPSVDQKKKSSTITLEDLSGLDSLINFTPEQKQSIRVLADALGDGLAESVLKGLGSLGSLENIESLEKLKDLGEVLAAGSNDDDEVAPANDVAWLTTFDHYRRAFLRTAKSQPSAASTYATRLLKLCKQLTTRPNLLSANERKTCVKSLNEMKKATGDNFVKGLLDEARTILNH